MKQQTEKAELEVTFLTEPHARFVSLVRRGANQTPFRVVKTGEKEEVPMKVLQSIIAKKGTDAEIIKKALGGDVADIVQLSSPKESGSFTTYDQHPREVFKADSFEVVVLNDDRTILGLQGELVEKSENVVTRIFKRAEQRPVISIAEGTEVLSQDVLKAQLGDKLWSELDAMRNAVSGIINQEHGDVRAKVTMVKSVFDNFLASLELASIVAKSDSFDLKPQAEADIAKSGKPEDGKAAEPAKAEQPEQAAKSADATAVDAKTEPVAQPKTEDIVAEAVAKAKQEVEAVMKAQIEEVTKHAAESMKEISGKLAAVTHELEQVKKAPASIVKTHADDGIEPQSSIQKGEKPSVFAGCFGSLRR